MSAARKRIGKYEILSVLGKGGMGVVYRGFDPTIERPVALKIVHPHLILGEDGAEFSQRFIQEAKAIARCNHPNIVTILEYGEDQGVPYMVMEYIEGQSLHEYLNTTAVIPLKSTVRILLQVLKALSFAHEKGIVHRDVKPPNILLLPNEQVKLTDFGIARMPASNLTQIGTAIGTPYYMSPEQAQGDTADGRSDLFSVGVIFSELLAQSPVTAHDSAVLPKIEGLPPKTRVNFTVNYPKALLPVIHKSLQPHPDHRFQSAQEFSKTLLEALKLSTTTQTKTAVTTQSLPPTAAFPVASKVSVELSQQQMVRIKQMLTPHLGPIADKMIARELAQQGDLPAVIANLAKYLPNATERQHFVAEITRHSQSKNPAPVDSANTGSDSQSQAAGSGAVAYVDAATVAVLCQSYTPYLGPLADRIVQKAVKKCTSKKQLLDYLGQQIPDSKEREQFLKKWYGFM